MDVVALVNHYKEIFKNPKDILDWIEHDLKHMGLEPEEIESTLTEANELLGKA